MTTVGCTIVPVEMDFASSTMATYPVQQVGVVGHSQAAAMGFPFETKLAGVCYHRVRSVLSQRHTALTGSWPFAQVHHESSVNLIHARNVLPLNSRRFIVSLDGNPVQQLERSLPWQQNLAQRVLGSPSCKAILLQSQIAARLFIAFCHRAGLHEIAYKTHLYRGMARGLARRVSGEPREERPRQDDSLKVVLTTDAEALDHYSDTSLSAAVEACHCLRRCGMPVELTVLVCGGQAQHRSSASADHARQDLHRTSHGADWIETRHVASQHRIQHLVAKHDVLLSPSLIPTSGWSVVCAALSGVPAIVSNVFHHPEIVTHQKTGLVLNLPVDQTGQWVGENCREEQRCHLLKQAKSQLTIHLTDALATLFSDRERLRKYGQAAAEQSRLMFGVKAASTALRQIYYNACS